MGRSPRLPIERPTGGRSGRGEGRWRAGAGVEPAASGSTANSASRYVAQFERTSGGDVDIVGNSVDFIGNEVDDIGKDVDVIAGEVDDIGNEVDVIGNEVDVVANEVDCIRAVRHHSSRLPDVTSRSQHRNRRCAARVRL